LDDGVIETFRKRDGSASNVVVEGNIVTWDDKEEGRLPGEPIKLPDRPIGIVQSIMTASAAESVVLSFTGQERVETFGTETGGFTTVNAGVDLPDGAVITLSFALMGDREGNFYDGTIAPDHEVDRFQGSALKEAQNWVATQCPA
jgi:carboxyl-terminal processing protease